MSEGSSDSDEGKGLPTGIGSSLIGKTAWPLLVLFIFLGYLDMLTTLIAYSSFGGFVELNSFAAALFRLGLPGFLLADLMKSLPVFPLAYMVSVETRGGHTDSQVGLLRLTAFIVLLVADLFLAWVVLANNIPSLAGALS